MFLARRVVLAAKYNRCVLWNQQNHSQSDLDLAKCDWKLAKEMSSASERSTLTLAMLCDITRLY
jgi:hypothetical protein